MSFPKYYATYCVLDGEAGSNPLWHASIILSTKDAETSPILVNDAIGLYAQPSSTTNPLIKGLKHIFGVKFDLQDSHGVLKREDMRYLDGNGLHGVTFEATAEQFAQLKSICEQRMALEKEAILELNAELHQHGITANGHTRFIKENALAALQQREPRLHPFHFTVDINSNGFDSSGSYTCKTYALNLLVQSGIISEERRDIIAGNMALHALPRFSQKLRPLRLVSTGEPKAHISSTGKIYYNREWDNRNKLFWATVPHTLDTELNKYEIQATLNQHQLIKNMLTRVRELEMTLLKRLNELDGAHHHKRRHGRLLEQLTRVRSLYEKFSVASENQLPNCLSEKLWHAETTLNVANMSLAPDRMNYPFMLRAYESMAVRYALLSLLGMLILTTFITNPVGAVLVSTAALSMGHQCYNFFKEETQFARMHADYSAFLQSKHKPTAMREKQVEPERLDSPRVTSPT